MTKICVPITAAHADSVLSEAAAAKAAGADLIEIWLGELHEPEEISKWFARLPLPAVVNCKGKAEKGGFGGSESEKVALLQKATQLGAAYVDVDAGVDRALLQSLIATKGKSRLILSAHFFDGTPGLPALAARAEAMQSLGAEVVKLAAQPKNLHDVVTMLRLAENLERKKIAHIVISMDRMGTVSRVFAPLFHNEMMFAVLDASRKTAPGQLTVNRLAECFKEW
jgi:3-dehydroquinate dehydratase type I